MSADIECPSCKGFGNLQKSDGFRYVCERCQGSGKIKSTEETEARLKELKEELEEEIRQREIKKRGKQLNKLFIKRMKLLVSEKRKNNPFFQFCK